MARLVTPRDADLVAQLRVLVLSKKSYKKLNRPRPERLHSGALLKKTRQLFQDYSIRRTAAEVFALPPKTLKTITKPMKPEQSVIYRSVSNLREIKVSLQNDHTLALRMLKSRCTGWKLPDLENETLVGRIFSRFLSGCLTDSETQPHKSKRNPSGLRKTLLQTQIACYPALVSWAHQDSLKSKKRKQSPEDLKVR